jgi:hypothetical protein
MVATICICLKHFPQGYNITVDFNIYGIEAGYDCRERHLTFMQFNISESSLAATGDLRYGELS